ncbi:MFS transporter [Pseudofrankia sp. BMG5.36]|uniref:MFS transporter n=1 Tax=Pseudofrankia sp. BMG5.36 TaxID=1834512 RepID=UPI0008DA041E|nr:MFS transporter [Pseudofrankia sp. BMG5.36]OHV58004.1 MFS transporter [Pseudofrankia sp. BMG5.36]
MGTAPAPVTAVPVGPDFGPPPVPTTPPPVARTAAPSNTAAPGILTPEAPRAVRRQAEVPAAASLPARQVLEPTAATPDNGGGGAADAGAADAGAADAGAADAGGASAYRWLLGLPGAKPMMAAGLLARLPVAMIGIGGMLLVAATTGSYGLAGATTAAIALAGAAAGPLIGRRIDVSGPRVVLPVLAGAHVVAGIAFLVAALTHAPASLLLVAAAATGATLPQVGPVARQRWANRLGDDRRLDAAYALESALDEVSFVTGPAAASVLAGLTPSAGVAAALLFAAVGTAAFAALPAVAAPAPPVAPSVHRRGADARRGPRSGPGEAPATRVTPTRRRPRREPSVLRTRGVTPVLVSACALGMFFGTMDVGLIAYARANGWGGAAGLLPSLLTATSLGAGVTYGMIRWRAGLVRRYAITAALLAAATALVPLAGWAAGIGAVAVAVALAGLPLAPMIITSTTIVGELVPAHRRTEGFSWIVIANGVGVAAGAPLAGAVVDQRGVDLALLALAACGFAVAATALLAARRLHTGRRGRGGMNPAARQRTEASIH